MRVFEYIFALIGACLLFIIFLDMFGSAHVAFFPMPEVVIIVFTATYFSFRKRLDRAMPYEEGSVVSAARVGLIAIVISGILAAMTLHVYAVPSRSIRHGPS